jgi:murein tripeptide amidase MpaA
MMQGFLEYACGEAKEAYELRSKLVIKAIPMLNPDGVVLGNFRTSLCGRDLNRAFRASVDALFP